MGLLNLVAIICLALWLCVGFRRRIEEVIPLTVLLWMLVLLLLAMARRLLWIDAFSVLVGVGSLAGLVWGIAVSRITAASAWAFCRRQILTPGLAAAALLAVFFLWSCSARQVYHPDEINYWGTFVRSLWVSNGFVDAAYHCTPQYATYAPGMQLLEWNALHAVGGWHESLLYAVLFWVNASFLLPLLATVRWKRGWMILPFVVATVIVPTCLTSSYYAILSTDGTLGMLFGLCLVLVLRATPGTFEKLSLSVALAGLAMVKESGMALALLVLLFAVLSRRRGAPRIPRWPYLAPVLCFGLWRLYCTHNGLTSFSTAHLVGFAASLGSGTVELPLNFRAVVTIFFRQLFTAPYNLAGWWRGTAPVAGLPTVIWFAFFIALPPILERTRPLSASDDASFVPPTRETAGAFAWRLALFPLLTFLAYVGTMVFSFLTVFSPELPFYGTENIPLMERYCSPFLMGHAILAATLTARRGIPVRYRVPLALVLTACLLCFANWANIADMAPSAYRGHFPDRVQADGLRQESWLALVDDPAHTVVLSITDTQIEVRVYALPPMVVLHFPTDPGQTNPAGNDLIQMIRLRRVTHVRVDQQSDASLAGAERFFGTSLARDTVYRLNWEGDNPVLSQLWPTLEPPV